MRKLLILLAFVLATVALPLEVTVRAEAPPAFVGAGALFQNGGSTEFVMLVGLNANIMRSDSGEATNSQIYVSSRFYYADDIGLDSAIAQQLEAISGYIIGEITHRSFFVATGTGIMTEFQDGENPYAPALLLEFGWVPTSRIRISVGSQYIPITGMGDLVYVGAGIGLQF